MGARASVSFRDENNKSIVVFSHWGGEEFHQKAKDYVRKLKEDIKIGKVNKSYPLGRLEADRVVIDFIREITKDMDRVESDLYLGKTEEDGDDSDYGHKTIDLHDAKTAPTPILNFTPFLAKEFERLYNKTLKEEKESFLFQGRVVLVVYAKYVMEYLNSKFKE